MQSSTFSKTAAIHHPTESHSILSPSTNNHFIHHATNASPTFQPRQLFTIPSINKPSLEMYAPRIGLEDLTNHNTRSLETNTQRTHVDFQKDFFKQMVHQQQYKQSTSTEKENHLSLPSSMSTSSQQSHQFSRVQLLQSLKGLEDQLKVLSTQPSTTTTTTIINTTQQKPIENPSEKSQWQQQQQQQLESKQTQPIFSQINSSAEVPKNSEINNQISKESLPQKSQKRLLSNDMNDFSDDEDINNNNPLFFNGIDTIGMSEEKLKDFSLIKEVIEYIVNFLDKDEEALSQKRSFIRESVEFQDKSTIYLLIFDQLTKKFKNLKKTKEEKTKFCMRKAFRYLFSQLKTNCSSKMNLKEANEICMKHYFSEHVHDSQFVLPFRRNSSIKTMNAAFLKKVFTSKKFSQDYRDFLQYFDQLAQEDNQKKIDQLAYYILPMVENNKFDKIGSLRRLPWTLNLLDSTRKLAFQLLEFEGGSSPVSVSISNEKQDQSFKKEDSYPETEQRPQTDSSVIIASPPSQEDALSSGETLSTSLSQRKVSDTNINIECLSRKQSIVSQSETEPQLFQQTLPLNPFPGFIDLKPQTLLTNMNPFFHQQLQENTQNYFENSFIKPLHDFSQLNWLQQLLPFQQVLQLSSLAMNREIEINKSLRRQVIILTPPSYNINEPQMIKKVKPNQ